MIFEFCGRSGHREKLPSENLDTVMYGSVTETPQPRCGSRETPNRRPKFQFRTRVMIHAMNFDDEDLMKRTS